MLSVLVPVYNVERYLPRCVDSILSQSYQDFELILVDDGSTDTSGQICDIYAKGDSRVRVIHKKNGGLGSARIAGMEQAGGEYVAFVDSDDYIECDMYKKLLAPFLGEPSIDISIGGYVIETNVGVISCPFVKVASEVYSASQAMIDMFENRKFNWSLCDKIYRRSLFEGGFSLQDWPRSYGEDTFVNWRLFQRASNVSYLPLYNYHYCIHDASMTQRKFSVEHLAYLDVWDQILQDSSCAAYANHVIRLMIDFGTRYIYEMQKNWEFYREKIDDYQALLNRHIFKYKYFMDSSEQWRLGLANRSQKDWIETQKRNRVEISQFISRFRYVFIYGAGVIANEVALEMEQQGKMYDGFVVSEEKTNPMKLFGKSVHVLSDLSVPKEDTGFILAMNKSNEMTVKDTLQSLEYKNIYLAGKESYFYM